MSRQLLFLELNEINFDYVGFYCARGLLPTFARLIRTHGVSRTHSEVQHDALEPWIQWVTAHTGMTLAEHGVFRLGDVSDRTPAQIWEQLESLGLKVGAISPMNAQNRTRSPAFFVPDPWTATTVTARAVLRNLYGAIAQAVNDNAEARVTARSTFDLVRGALTYARPLHYLQYLHLVTSATSAPWRKAMFLDLLLADVFVREVEWSRPDFATLFLNAGAHIQHHYMFCSAAYEGPHRNPTWYVAAKRDPVLEVYQLYDRIIRSVMHTFPRARLMLATGLHQDPHGDLTFYWRLRHHADFLAKIGLPFSRVEPRMSRDFLVICDSEIAARNAQHLLEQVVGPDGSRVFEVDNRGRDLFVMLTYACDIGPDFEIRVGDRRLGGFQDDVAFVALKNGEHNGTGYFLDTGIESGPVKDTFALATMPDRIRDALGLRSVTSTTGRSKVGG